MIRSRVESVPTSTAWLLAEIAEHHGREGLFVKQSPQALRALRETALVQSVESSNRIEGVVVSPDRLRPLVLGRAKPIDRSEAEVRGYREAMGLIQADAAKLDVAPATIRRLHKMIQRESGDAGQWKRVNNEIVELRPGSAPVVRFTPVGAVQTPGAMEDLCRTYRHVLDQTKVPPLLVDALLVLDFLCVHPFRDGNGRVSRLLTLLTMQRHGYGVGRYISIERLIEESRQEYYGVLHECSRGWHEGRHDWGPWANFYLGVILRAYRQFEKGVAQVKGPRGAKRRMVEDAIAAGPRQFTVRDLEQACPAVSREMIRRVLREMKAEGGVACIGRGPGAKWTRKR